MERPQVAADRYLVKPWPIYLLIVPFWVDLRRFVHAHRSR